MEIKIIKFLTSDKFYGPIVAILIAVIIYKIISKLISRAIIKGQSDIEAKRRRTLLVLFENIVGYALVIITLVLVLNIYGVNTISIISGLGIIGIVVGLALQDTMKDIINGITIIMEKYFVVGDIIKCNGFIGTVTDFGLKSTKIIDNENKVMIIANRNIADIVNMSYKRTNMYIEVLVSNEMSEKNVEKVILDIIKKLVSYNVIIEKESGYKGIIKVDSFSSTYNVKLQCSKINSEKAKALFYSELKKVHDENKINLI